MIFHGYNLVFHGFHGSRLVFHGARSFFMVSGFFHGSRSVFMVIMVPGWFFIFHIENNLKLYSGLTIQFRPKHCFGAYLLFVTKNIVFAHINKIATKKTLFLHIIGISFV